jgi:DNA-binding transcriptional regulator GbsR (MarR family)
MDSNEKIIKAQERVIEAIANNMDLYGVTPSIGRLFGTMYFHDKPMTLDEMKESLQMSKTSMSTSIKTLTDLNCVEKIWKKGERKDLYLANEDWQQIFIDYFSIQWRKAIIHNLDSLQKSKAELIAIIDDASKASDLPLTTATDNDTIIVNATFTLDKIELAINYYKWLSSFINKLEAKEFI